MASRFSFDVVHALVRAASTLLSTLALFAADPVQAVFEKAASALAAEDYVNAERGFQSVLKAQLNNIAALGNLGVVYSKTRRYVQAIDVYRRALRLAPGEVHLETNLGLAYIKQEQYSAALPIFEKLATDASNLQARELMATCHLSLGQLDKALALLQPLHAADPKNPGVLSMLGVVYVKLKRADEAREAFTEMMGAVTPAQANFLMGKASYETGRFQEAAEYFRKSLEADPAFAGTHRELGKTLISLRDDHGAEKELRQTASDDPEALYYLGALLAKSSQPEAAGLLIKAQELTPDAWGPAYYLGRLYLEQGKVNEALPCLERAAKLKPDEPAIQYQLGRALQKAGRQAEARAAFARVQQLKSRGLQSEIDKLTP